MLAPLQSAAFGQPRHGSPYMGVRDRHAESIGRVDGNKDKKLSFAEFSAGPLGAFDRMDRNKDGTLSVAEQKGQAEGR